MQPSAVLWAYFAGFPFILCAPPEYGVSQQYITFGEKLEGPISKIQKSLYKLQKYSKHIDFYAKNSPKSENLCNMTIDIWRKVRYNFVIPMDKLSSVLKFDLEGDLS